MKNMNRLVFYFMFVLIFVSCKAQDSQRTIYPINWKSVSALAKSNPDSIRTLIKRLTQQELDTTLTYEERGVAYAGQTYLPEHKGLWKELDDIRDLINKDKFAEAKQKNMAVLKRCPVNLWAVDNMLDIVDNELRDSTKVSEFTKDDLKYYTRLWMRLFNTIAATGHGTAEHPFDVVFVHDEYLFMKYYLEIKHGTQSLVANGGVAQDRFSVAKKSKYYSKDDIYFDITRVLELERE